MGLSPAGFPAGAPHQFHDQPDNSQPGSPFYFLTLKGIHDGHPLFAQR
jgi:hypothetical protein